jgi:hypothetical protein
MSASGQSARDPETTCSTNRSARASSRRTWTP